MAATTAPARQHQLRPPAPAAALLADLRARGVRLWAEGGRVKHRARSGQVTMRDLLQIKRHEAALARLLTAEEDPDR